MCGASTPLWPGRWVALGAAPPGGGIAGMVGVSCTDVGFPGMIMIVSGDHWNAVVHR
jgi:hypothetical protein